MSASKFMAVYPIGIYVKATNVDFMVALKEKSGDHQKT